MEWILQHEALIAGFVGALIGAAASVITVCVQAKYQARRERLNVITTIALEDYKSMIELAKSVKGDKTLPPAVLYLHYYLEIAKMLEKGVISPADIERLNQENEKIRKALLKL